MLQTIIDAIRKREHLSFVYSGISRVVQPAAVGVCKNGNTLLRCFQVSGGHITPGHAWELCDISKISDLCNTGENFSTDPPQYRRGDKALATIYAEL